MFELGLDRVLSEDLWVEACTRAAASLDFSDENMTAVVNEVGSSHYVRR